MVQRRGNLQPAQYRLHWGTGYVPTPADEIHDVDHFNHPSYSDADRRKIDRLKVGATLDLSDRLPEGYTPRKVVHTIERLS